MKRTIIKYRKLLDGRIEIVDFENIAYVQDLPKIYEEGKPHYYLYGNIVYYTDKDGRNGMFAKETAFSQEEFQHLITTMKEAGKRLKKILQNQREAKIKTIYI